MSITERIAERIRRAHLQAEDLTRQVELLAPVLTQVAVEDSPRNEQLLREAGEDLERAQQRVREARAKIDQAVAGVEAAAEAGQARVEEMQAGVEEAKVLLNVLKQGQTHIDAAAAGVEEAKTKVGAATAGVKEVGEKVGAAVGHMFEEADTAVEHQHDLAHIATYAGNLDVYIRRDPEFVGKVLGEVDLPIFRVAFERLPKERQEEIRELMGSGGNS